jgi:hypothetical protein
MRRIRTMRDAIYKKSSRADEVVVKGPSRELTRLRQSTAVSAANSNYGDDNGDDEQQQKKAYIENMENYKNLPYCTYCCKNFERKAVLQSHIQSCRKKHRKQQAAAAKAASPLTVDLDRVKIEQRSDTPDSMRTTNSADSMVAMNGGTMTGGRRRHLGKLQREERGAGPGGGEAEPAQAKVWRQDRERGGDDQNRGGRRILLGGRGD